MVVKISPSGEVLSSLMDRHGETVFTVSAVTEFGGKLWLGNLAGDFVSVVDLEKANEQQDQLIPPVINFLVHTF